ncbi:MAG TPA: tocopherol cyclase family protein [Clostridia bacterium]
MARIFNPEIFQGVHKHRNYFEGWYFKLISRDRSRVLALIPGIAMGRGPQDAHSFIQVIDAHRNRVAYLRYPIEAFQTDHERFDILVGKSRFHSGGLSVDHEGDGHVLQGDVSFSDIVPYPKTRFHRGIMGPFTFVPFMECRHGIVNIRQSLHGKLAFDGEILDFEGGEGYVEKDWGSSFPESWIWLQANHFDDPQVSFMFSVAEIPWLGSRFTGMISFLRTAETFRRFATYNRSHLDFLSAKWERVDAVIHHPEYTLEMEARFSPGGVLRVPKNGIMERTIEESISAEVAIRLIDRRGSVLFEGKSGNVGMEISEGVDKFNTR